MSTSSPDRGAACTARARHASNQKETSTTIGRHTPRVETAASFENQKEGGLSLSVFFFSLISHHAKKASAHSTKKAALPGQAARDDKQLPALQQWEKPFKHP
jgi:hypothetical protein